MPGCILALWPGGGLYPSFPTMPAFPLLHVPSPTPWPSMPACHTFPIVPLPTSPCLFPPSLPCLPLVLCCVGFWDSCPSFALFCLPGFLPATTFLPTLHLAFLPHPAPSYPTGLLPPSPSHSTPNLLCSFPTSCLSFPHPYPSHTLGLSSSFCPCPPTFPFITLCYPSLPPFASIPNLGGWGGDTCACLALAFFLHSFNYLLLCIVCACRLVLPTLPTLVYLPGGWRDGLPATVFPTQQFAFLPQCMSLLLLCHMPHLFLPNLFFIPAF